MSDNPNSTKYWLQTEYKEMISKKRGHTSNLCKMFPTVLGCCNEDL